MSAAEQDPFNARVLVMDDEEIIREIASEALSAIGCEVALARDGEEAVRLYSAALEEKRPFSLVIMDMTIPKGKGGRETICELKRLDPSVNAIVSSGQADFSVPDLKMIGFSGIIMKPFRIAELREAVKSHCPKKGGAA